MMEGMFDMEFAKYISSNSNLGLGAMLYKKLTGEDMPKAVHQSYVVPSTPAQPVNTPGMPRRLLNPSHRPLPSKNESKATATRFRPHRKNME